MKNNYKLIICPCGCKKKFHKSRSSPIGWKPTAYYGFPKKLEPEQILEIEREDGVTFRVGDTVQRVTERGRKMGKGIIYKIKDDTKLFLDIGMRLFVHMIGHNGTANISNVRYVNADSPNMFRFLKNITKKR